MRSKTLVMGLLLACLVSAGVAAQELKFTAIESEPYFASTLPENGFLAAVASEAFKRAGYTMKIDYRPFARALQEAKRSPYTGIFGFYHNEEREADFLYSSPLFNIEIVFLGLKKNRISYQTLGDLAGKSVGVLNGADNGPDFNAATNIRKDVAQNKPSNVRKLLAGRVDLIVEIKDIALKIISDEKAEDLVEVVGKPLQVKPLYIGFARSNPDAAKLKSAFDQGLAAMKKDGTFNKIRDKFGIAK